jgi:hypothetical protein
MKRGNKMRILVLNDEGDGTASVRERRDVFDIAEFRLSYTCPDCGSEFVFNSEKYELLPTGEPDLTKTAPLPGSEWCLVCHTNMGMADRGEALWRAIKLYREFYDYTHRNKVPLKLVTTRVGSIGQKAM